LFIAIGHLLFLGLFLLAYKYFMVRCIHVDSAYQIFKWVNNSGVEVEVHRFSAVFPQLIVKLLRAFNVDLNRLLIVASLAHVLVPYTIFIVLAHLWRMPWLAVGCALAAVLCTRLTFYGIVLEANYLLCYPILFAGALLGPYQRQRSSVNGAMVLGALVLVLTVHPVGFLIALFILALFFPLLTSARKTVLLLGAFCILWGAFSRVVLPPSSYETELYSSAGQGLSHLSDLLELPASQFLVGHSWQLTTHYLATWILLSILIGILAYSKKWYTLLVVVGSIIGYVLLNVLTYSVGEAAMMMEKNFLPLATLISLPLMMALGVSTERYQRWAVLPFLVVLFIQFRGIAFASRPAHERFDLIHDLVGEVREKGIRNAIVSGAELDHAGLHIHWALAYETLLLSAVDGPNECVIVHTDKTLSGNKKRDISLLDLEPSYSIGSLRQQYFRIVDTHPERLSPALLNTDE